MNSQTPPPDGPAAIRTGYVATASTPQSGWRSGWRRFLRATLGRFEADPAQFALWRFNRSELRPMLLVALPSLLIAMPLLLGWLHPDPMLWTSGLTRGYVRGLLPGVPHIDPNNGFTTQALSYRAALDWLHGEVPWWNPYSGVGLPLAANYQSAPFFPLTLLVLLPNGVEWRHLALELLAGWGTYALLRQLGLRRTAAVTGGILYGLNGTLAWFDFAAAFVTPFLPWMLLGIERAYAKAGLGLQGGWRLFAAAFALNLAAGFPETAYFNGLLALTWAALRLFQTPSGPRLRYATLVAIGGMAGLALISPQILAFLEYLPDATIGGHSGMMARWSLHSGAMLPSLVSPYIYGPPFAVNTKSLPMGVIFGNVGGYVTLATLVVALYGAFARFSGLTCLLLAWTALTLAKTFGLWPFIDLWNLLPGVAETAFYRYAQPTWEMSLIVLAAIGIDNVIEGDRLRRRAVLGVMLVLLPLIATAGIVFGSVIFPHIGEDGLLKLAVLLSAAWVATTTFACLILLVGVRSRWRGFALAAILATDATLMYALPTLSNPRGGSIDFAAVQFLQGNLGLQRFYALGQIQPSYPAYFGIASINHQSMPGSQRWVDWIHARLDSQADAQNFNGNFPRPGASQTQELKRNFDNYEEAGVKFVVTPPGMSASQFAPPGKVVKLAYADDILRIFELPEPKPYFEALGGPCRLQVQDRTHVTADCEAPATLLRRELFFPGWTALLNGADASIDMHDDVFQVISLPQGQSEVRYRYAPPHVGWTWLAWWAAMIVWAAPAAAWLRKRSRRTVRVDGLTTLTQRIGSNDAH